MKSRGVEDAVHEFTRICVGPRCDLNQLAFKHGFAFIGLAFTEPVGEQNKAIAESKVATIFVEEESRSRLSLDHALRHTQYLT